MKKSALFVSLFVVAIMLAACSPSSGTLTVTDAWARTASAGDNGAAYFIIKNDTSADDTLLSVRSDIASATEIHISMMEGDIMSMKPQESVLIPAKGNVEFKTGGLHVMFIDLNRDLKVGDTITLTLVFEKAGEIVLQVEVKQQ